jgi:hypothetical protein
VGSSFYPLSDSWTCHVLKCKDKPTVVSAAAAAGWLAEQVSLHINVSDRSALCAAAASVVLPGMLPVLLLLPLLCAVQFFSLVYT